MITETAWARRRWALARCLASAAATIALAAPLTAQQYVATLDAAQTKIEYSVDSTLHTVHGTFALKSGEIHFDPSTGKASGHIVVDATSGDSGNKSRDKKMHQEVLESPRYPEITFTPQQITGTFNPHAASQLEISGIFQLRGKDHPLTATISVQPPEGAVARSTVHFTIPYIKWGLKDPSTWLLKASDTVALEIQATAKLATDQPEH